MHAKGGGHGMMSPMPVLITPPGMPEAVVGAIETMGNRARTELLHILGSTDRGMTTQELADAVDGNRIQVREHLLEMEKLQLVSANFPAGERAGRKILWQAHPERIAQLAKTWQEYAQGQRRV